MRPKGNILKDSFYKERLVKSNNATVYTGHEIPDGQADDDSPCQEEKQLDMKKCLTRFSKTQDGSNYAFLNFSCTHKLIRTIWKISAYKDLEEIDLSYNKLKSLKYLSGLRYLIRIKATNNLLTSVMDVKVPPLHLDTLDLSFNQIVTLSDMSPHQHLRVLLLKGNKIQKIEGLKTNKKLTKLDLSENSIQQISGLDNLFLTELNLSTNQIQKVKGFNHLEHLRVLDLSINKITKMGGLVNLISLRVLNLSKNNLKNVREIDYLENLMYLTSLDLSYNPIQERRYYSLQIYYKMPMLQLLDGVQLTASAVVQAQSLYGLDVQQKFSIFKKLLPEEEFIDRRIHTSELIQNQTDSEGQQNNFVDEYDDEGNRTSSKDKNKSLYGSKRSMFSKNSKNSKRSNFSKS